MYKIDGTDGQKESLIVGLVVLELSPRVSLDWADLITLLARVHTVAIQLIPLDYTTINSSQEGNEWTRNILKPSVNGVFQL